MAKVGEISPSYLLALSFTLSSIGYWKTLYRLKQLDDSVSMFGQIG